MDPSAPDTTAPDPTEPSTTRVLDRPLPSVEGPTPSSPPRTAPDPDGADPGPSAPSTGPAIGPEVPPRPPAWSPPAETPATPPPGGGGLGRYLAVAAVSAVVAAGVAVPVTRATLPEAAASATAPVRFESGESLIAAIAQQVGPSVARIDVVGATSRGSGSAVVYRADGYLVTNAHVVDGAQRITVTLPSGASHEAELVGSDPRSDLAVVRIDATDLPVPAYADSAPVVGDTAIAIGSPFGLDGSVTSGIVSALNRTVSGAGTPLIDLIQTDAAINPGNSGGALVNGSGEIIGINTAILSGSGGNQGIGFAIPVASVQAAADQLIEHGVVRHAYLGVQGQTVDPEVAQLYGLPVDQGAVLVAVVPGSPADDLGLQRGDIVTAIDGVEIRSMEELAGRLQQRAPGERVTLTYYRNGVASDIDVVLGEQPNG